MSKHSSLKRKGGATGKRSVMKRFERIKVLRERGKWQEGTSPIGLPKTKGEA
ncbi:MAG: small basic protein [Verrucomicrobiales bacterium]